MSDKRLICLTPVKDEAWILDTFLKCASLWADVIVICDQMSTDGSREIARRYSKVYLIDNTYIGFDGFRMRQLMFDYVRKNIQGEHIYITLDADEILVGSNLKQKLLKLNDLVEDTAVSFLWYNFHPVYNKMWFAQNMLLGYVDDYKNVYTTSKIHESRVPQAKNTYAHNGLSVLHLQYIDWQRMQSKHRWYECFEHVHFPEKSFVSIYRQYHHMYSLKRKSLMPLPKDFFEEYQNIGIDPFAHKKEDFYRWDYEILDLLKGKGTKYFRRCDIWKIDWNRFNHVNKKSPSNVLSDPRNIMEKIIMFYLEKTQPYFPNVALKIFDKIIKLVIH